MFDLSAVQSAVRDAGLDGWLLYDFRGLNLLARRVVGMPGDRHLSRRWFYLVPAEGPPRKLVHAIETAALDFLPGEAAVYLRWQELEAGLRDLLAGRSRVAMEYAPKCANPYISRVDAGTVELVRSFGAEVESSGDLIQLFEAVWDDEQWELHRRAAGHTRAAYDRAYQLIADRLKAGRGVTEVEVQDRIMRHFADNGLVTDHPPVVAVGRNSGDPHYDPQRGSDAAIEPGSFLLIDLWAKVDHPKGVFSDLTRTAFVGGGELPAEQRKVFEVVRDARDAAVDRVRKAFAAGEELFGWQVDRAGRDVIDRAGYGDHFIHRIGHNIGAEAHGNGAHMDDLETRETRRVLRRTCFSVEPGVYLPEFGVRNEVNVYVDAAGQVHVTGGPVQDEVDRIEL